jgi:hypothetical protein
LQAFKDYYFILGLGKDATQEEIHRAYRQSVDVLKKSRLDGPAADASIAAILGDIEESYRCLSDRDRRNSYDMSMMEFMPPQSAISNRNVHDGARYDGGYGYSGKDKGHGIAGKIWAWFKTLVFIGCLAAAAMAGINYYVRAGTDGVISDAKAITSKISGVLGLKAAPIPDTRETPAP